MALPRRCSECENFLPAGSIASRKTCSANCRAKRHRRLAAQRKKASHVAADQRQIPQDWKDVLEDVGHEVAKEELRPVVREALTEDSMQSLQKMVKLLPGVVEELQRDIHHEDEVVRQKAHQMVLRYTLGHEKALPPDDKAPTGLTVNFTMPRPDATAEVSATELPVDADADELRICDTCQEPKPLADFFQGALRCRSCVAAFQARAHALLEPPAPATGEEHE